MQRPIYLSGKVMMDDGTPPPESVVIERICNGVRRPEGYTDSKGRFSFQLGENRAMLADASVSGHEDLFGNTGGLSGNSSSGSRTPGMGGRPVTERDLMGCELRAALPGFRSDVINLSGRRVFDNPEVGVIVLHRLGNVEGTTISFTSLQAPKDAKKAYEKAREALRKKKPADAQKELEKAVAIYPKYAAAWYELGRLRQAQQDTEGARKAYQEALAADAKYVNPYLQLALMSAMERKWDEVAETCDRIVRLNPVEFPQAYYFSAVANYNLGKMETAEKNAREAQKIDTEHLYPRVDHLLGVILAQKRDYDGALAQMRSYLQFAPNAKDADVVKKQISELERVTGAAAKPQQ
jgi:tetratricopeptide (TPR) repeat protein